MNMHAQPISHTDTELGPAAAASATHCRFVHVSTKKSTTSVKRRLRRSCGMALVVEVWSACAMLTYTVLCAQPGEARDGAELRRQHGARAYAAARIVFLVRDLQARARAHFLA